MMLDFKKILIRRAGAQRIFVFFFCPHVFFEKTVNDFLMIFGINDFNDFNDFFQNSLMILGNAVLMILGFPLEK